MVGIIYKKQDWMPYSPYTNRIENADKLRIMDATQIKIVDNHLFWNGSGSDNSTRN